MEVIPVLLVKVYRGDLLESSKDKTFQEIELSDFKDHNSYMFRTAFYVLFIDRKTDKSKTIKTRY